jgi:hypothetical protein
MSLVITACSNRKSNAPPRALRAGAIPAGTLEEVGRAWLGRVRAATNRVAAADLYQGRSFVESRASARALGADLYVISAGLGLLREDSQVPAYSLTVTGEPPDNVLLRVKPNGEASPSAWWDMIVHKSPLGTGIAELVRGSSPNLVLLALPSAYLDMVSRDLAEIHGRSVSRLRFFARAIPASFPDKLRPAVMPYDDRLDGPDSTLQGTRTDFAARALHHFAAVVLHNNPDGSLDAHRRAVRSALSRWRRQVIPDRPRRTDSELIALIRDNWKAAEGKSGRMLRVLRDDLGVACEQSRFIKLFEEAKAGMRPWP